MIIIGEKINGAIPAVGEAIAGRDESEIRRRVKIQAEAGADYIDCAASCETELEYDAMRWLIDIIESETELPISIDSPNAALLARLIGDKALSRAGIVNSVSMEGEKLRTVLPIIAGTEWKVIGLTCDNDGIPHDSAKRREIAKTIIDEAFACGIRPEQLFIDPCVLSLSTTPNAALEFLDCIDFIHGYAEGVRVIGALSNISYSMPARKFVNMGFMAFAVQAGLDAAIMDPTSENMMGMLYAAAALSGADAGGRKYNRAYRKGIIGAKK